MTIIEYINCDNIIVKFENKEIKKTKYCHFKSGQIKSKYDKIVYVIGYEGEGKYKISINNKHTEEYRTWIHMLERCYSNKYHVKFPTYKDCIVYEEWHNFQNFAKWYNENYYNVNNETMCLDKDILYKGNKIYSPNTCMFVPEYINTLFTQRTNDRGNELIGVKYWESKNSFGYRARCSIKKNGKVKNINLGNYNTELEAFYAYKQFKEKYIKQVADEYKDKIPKKLYNAMYSWKVEIND